MLKKKINLISKNIIEAKRELHENYQENPSVAEKTRAKYPVKEMNAKVLPKNANRNKSSIVLRPSNSSNPKVTKNSNYL